MCFAPFAALVGFYPHFVFASYGSAVTLELSERLIRSGVDMFLSHYRA